MIKQPAPASASVLVFTLFSPLHLLDLVHCALEDVALVRLDTETGNVPNVGGQQLGQLLDIAALQLPSPLLHAAGNKDNNVGRGFNLNLKQMVLH